jgi:hypothetical protein
MNIYIDESIHEKYSFMLLAFVLCQNDPQEELGVLLNKHDVTEFHACEKMEKNYVMQELRQELVGYINSKCIWGVLILPSSRRFSLLPDLIELFRGMQEKRIAESVEIYIDEGILEGSELADLKKLEVVKDAQIACSKTVYGIQLADLVAGLCGVRLREEISGNPKMLMYGEDCGYNPPIKAELGFELWTALRYSMLHAPESFGEEMPSMATFPTRGYGFFTSRDCTESLQEKADRVFGAVYLGCIH